MFQREVVDLNNINNIRRYVPICYEKRHFLRKKKTMKLGLNFV
jgi:hypothetical protein